jgi:type I restriction enzyme, R subunit
LIADYVLEYSDGLPIAVIEAKRLLRDPADGFEQVKRYAELLDVPFAYATNGQRTIELDARAGTVRDVLGFPSPNALWARYLKDRELPDDAAGELASAPLNASLRNWDGTPKTPRYYQQVAINRAVQAIARGDSRLLLVLATGTGKTFVAAQIVAKLWNKDWPGGRKPRVLYLADRNILVDQPKDEYFQPMFGDAVHKLGGGDAKTGRHIYFALYQSLDSGTDEARLYLQFPPDYGSRHPDAAQYRAVSSDQVDARIQANHRTRHAPVPRGSEVLLRHHRLRRGDQALQRPLVRWPADAPDQGRDR